MIEVSKTALNHFNKQGLYVVLSVNNKGCSGRSYNIYTTDTLDNNLELVESNFYIDTRYKEILQGSVIDYKQDSMFSSLVILNPNEQSRCGCGESFA